MSIREKNNLSIEQNSKENARTTVAVEKNIVSADKKLNFWALVCVIFFTVSGGAFGIEPLVGKMGAGWAIALILITPLLWSLPIALMVAELSSALPAEGGCYVWVRRALGDFWGVQEGWWTICFTAVDMAVYPVLFVSYLAFFVPGLRLNEDGSSSWETFWLRWGTAVALILTALIINWLGVKAVGRNAILNTVLVLLSFFLFVSFGSTQESNLPNAWHAIKSSFAAAAPDANLIVVGLATVLWNYCAWDNVSTFAGEVNDPPKNYPRALFAVLPIVVLAYLLPVLIGVGVTTSEEVWNESAGFPVLAQAVGGEFLGIAVAMAALLSAWSLFNSQLLYVSRMPFVMARDGWLLAWLGRLDQRSNVPFNALLASCAVSATFAALPFGKLVVIDILLYSAALSLEFVALVILRRKEADLLRPFKIPGGAFALAFICAAPLLFIGTIILAVISDPENDYRQIYVVAAMLASGALLYFLKRRNLKQVSEI